jgi:hypothetical protein
MLLLGYLFAMTFAIGRRRLLSAPCAIFAACLLTASCATAQAEDPPASPEPFVADWSPNVKAAEHYARHRAGSVRFAIVGPDGEFHGFHASRPAPAASVFKAMLLAAYLRQESVRHRALRPGDRRLLRPMITRSDNAAATQVNAIIGGRIYRLARAAHMRRFHWDSGTWGLSRTTPRDQVNYFLRLESLIPARHRAYALHLLASVIGPQRWGVGRVPHHGWQLYFKGGWGSGSGRVDHQVALLEHGQQRIALAIFTEFDPSHQYGKQTLRGVAKRLLAGLPE